ncbi:MAG: tetratricopeptide repeat protein [Proteobacteria bacterium]|nr:tetratricopeptide repeat protein [Pseudomonadota bacterium]
MMFEQLDRIANPPAPENTRFIPVSSLEEVAMNLQESDDENRYEYYLVQIRHPKSKPAEPVREEAPAPRAPVSNVPADENAASATFKAEKDDVPYLSDNADLLLQAGEINLARNIYRAILKSGEASDLAYAGLAACSDKEGLIEQAIQFAWDSVAFAPNKKGYQILSQLLVQQGRDQEASQALGRALRSLELSIQEKAEYHKMIGNCLSRLGQNNEAERSYRNALELSPASDEVQSNLGSLYLEQGQVPEAKRCYQDAIAANPSNDKALVGLGLCFVSEGDKEAAHEAFARSLEKNLRNSTAIFHLVKCAYEIKKYTTAEKMLSNYVEVAPVSPSLLYSLAGLQFHVGKKKEASTTARRILQIKGDHQGARDLMSRIEAEEA